MLVRKKSAPDDKARSIVPWTEDQAAFALCKSAGPIGHAAIDPQTESAHGVRMGVTVPWRNGARFGSTCAPPRRTGSCVSTVYKTWYFKFIRV